MPAYRIAFREKNADKIRAPCIKKHCQNFKEACQQMEMMLPLVADAPVVALEILSDLTRMQIVLLSCAATAAGQCFTGMNSRDWTEEEKVGFTRKFTTYVDGPWDQERIWNEIWSKLDRFSRDTEILKLVIN